MSWLKLDDQYFDHPKIAAAGRDGALLDLAGMLYCARYLTDGQIPAGIVRRLAPIDDPAACAATLVAVRRWEVTDDGYLVHDYLDYNPTRAKVLFERARDLARKKGLPFDPAAFNLDGAHTPGTTQPTPPAADLTAALAPLLAIIEAAPRDVRTGAIEWRRVYDAHPEADHGTIAQAEAFSGLARLGVEEPVALDLARTRTAACLDWLDHPERFRNAKNPAGLIIKRLRALPSE